MLSKLKPGSFNSCTTGNECRENKTGVICCRYQLWVTSRAAEFCTLCTRVISVRSKPAFPYPSYIPKFCTDSTTHIVFSPSSSWLSSCVLLLLSFGLNTINSSFPGSCWHTDTHPGTDIGQTSFKNLGTYLPKCSFILRQAAVCHWSMIYSRKGHFRLLHMSSPNAFEWSCDQWRQNHRIDRTELVLSGISHLRWIEDRRAACDYSNGFPNV